jgi:hypothetical protein
MYVQELYWTTATNPRVLQLRGLHSGVLDGCKAGIQPLPTKIQTLNTTKIVRVTK